MRERSGSKRHRLPLKLTHKRIFLGTKSATVGAGQKATVRIGLSTRGRALLTARHRLAARLQMTQTLGRRKPMIAMRTLRFRAPKPKHRRMRH